MKVGNNTNKDLKKIRISIYKYFQRFLFRRSSFEFAI